jgi:hypothetical protein
MITEQPKQPSNNFTMRMVDEEQAYWTFLILIKVDIHIGTHHMFIQSFIKFILNVG